MASTRVPMRRFAVVHRSAQADSNECWRVPSILADAALMTAGGQVPRLGAGEAFRRYQQLRHPSSQLTASEDAAQTVPSFPAVRQAPRAFAPIHRPAPQQPHCANFAHSPLKSVEQWPLPGGAVCAIQSNTTAPSAAPYGDGHRQVPVVKVLIFATI